MIKAIGIIESEHRGFGAVLHCLDNLVRDIETRGQPPDFVVFHLIVAYIREFLDRYHHPKEDAYLFKALCKRCPEAIPMLDALAVEHEMGPVHIEAVERALKNYETKGAIAFLPFRDAVNTYVAFERAHMKREETEVLPRAREMLTAEDWAAIGGAFSANEDPLFGAAAQKRFQKLFTAIVSLAPAPYGLGPAEKSA